MRGFCSYDPIGDAAVARQLVGTFADLILYNHELTVNCDACQHRGPVSVSALAARLGENYRVQAFIERAVCSKCGAH